MAYYLASFVAYFVVSFALGIFWVLLLFKQRYQAASGGFALENPIFPIGFAGITLFAVAVITTFSFAFPLLGPGYGAAFTIVLIMWMPHYVNNLGTAAKYKIEDRREWLLLELGFNLLNVAVLAAAMRLVYLWFH